MIEILPPAGLKLTTTRSVGQCLTHLVTWAPRHHYGGVVALGPVVQSIVSLMLSKRSTR